ncbi:xylulokinase [Micromonospora sp. CPCC 206061]|uniref:xylulokinase n=1 Tax=Micromonospora sp. CPCC 206061 TaxID=3122410 RepID=UPI002FEEA516
MSEGVAFSAARPSKPGGTANAFLGVDLGTSGLKLALLGADGSLVAEAEAGYEVRRPHAGWAETDPAEWVATLRTARAALPPASIAAVGVTGQMHGAVLCDESGVPVRPAVLWPDQRATAELDRWGAIPAPARDRLANPLAPGMTGPIVAWLAAHEPDAVARATHLLLPKDFLRLTIAGPPVTERSDASATLLWDVVGDDWSAAAVAAADIPARLLPEVVSPDTVVGSDGDAAVIAGCADTPAALLAVGTVDDFQINLGTGAQVLRRVAAPQPVASPVTHLYAAADEGWYAMAAVQNAGLALDWVCGVLGFSWADLVEAAAAGPAGAGGVTFLPFLTGERGGLAGPSSRGGWLGLRASTTRLELARAAVEAMVFAVRRAAELLGPLGPAVRLTGGGGREPLVRQLLADALGVVVRRVEVRSASATGAALLAARAVGANVLPDRACPPDTVPRPNPALESAYSSWLEHTRTA